MWSEILKKEVRFEAVRSRGPGGQNVNKVNSAAILYWRPLNSKFFSLAQMDLLIVKLDRHFNSAGEIFLRSDEFRDLERNKARCLDKLEKLIEAALYVPKKRRPTKPTFGSKQKNRQSKTKRAETKKQRQKVNYDR
jgi:ribosome-associated protein